MSDELVKRLRGRTTKKLFNDWHVGRDCPECGSMADRPKCLLDYGPSCPRHDPDAYDPPAWDHVADKDCAEAADRIEALTAKLATCEKYRDAYAECDRIGTQAVRDLEVRLAKAHEKEIAVWSENYAAMERKLEAARADTKKAVEALLLARVHVANNEQGWSVGRASARSDLKIINATLAEIEGEKG